MNMYSITQPPAGLTPLNKYYVDRFLKGIYYIVWSFILNKCDHGSMAKKKNLSDKQKSFWKSTTDHSLYVQYVDS